MSIDPELYRLASFSSPKDTQQKVYIKGFEKLGEVIDRS